MILHDLVSLPLELLDPPYPDALEAVAMAERVFWSVNLFVSFLMGYIDHTGAVITQPHRIAQHYARTWLCLDLMVVGFAWLEIILGPTLGHAGAVSLFRMARILRIFRLLKAQEVTGFVVKHVRSEFVILVAAILKIMFVMLGLTHVIACAWYGVGIVGPETSGSWVRNQSLESEEFIERYLRSFLCSLGFFSGEHVAPPVNTQERAFACGVLVFTFIISVWFVSSITTAMTRLSILAGSHASQLIQMSRYMTDKGISRELALKVERNAQYALAERKRNAPEESIELLQMVSDPLRSEIHFEVFSPKLLVHPFFRCYIDANPQGVRKLCHEAFAQKHFSRGDLVFMEHEVANPLMYFISSGVLRYSQDQAVPQQVGTDNWVAEATLWTTWMHQGTLTAASECQLLTLDAETFQDIVSKLPSDQVRSYAIEFVNRLCRSDQSELTDIGRDDWRTGQIIAVAFPDHADEHSPRVGARPSWGSWGMGSENGEGKTHKLGSFSPGDEFGRLGSALKARLSMVTSGLSSVAPVVRVESPSGGVSPLSSLRARR